MLRELAFRHLARYATTSAGLIRVLDRRVQRWARESAAGADEIRAARQAVRSVATQLAEAGVVDDAAFAESRARSLTRTGHSRRAVAAHLAARGVAQEVVQQAIGGDAQTELAAAVALAWRRRIGPFGPPADAEARRRALGMLARAGFARNVAEQALRLSLDEAERLLARLRQS